MPKEEGEQLEETENEDENEYPICQGYQIHQESIHHHESTSQQVKISCHY